MKKIKEYYDALPPDKKRMTIILCVLILIALFVMMGYKSRVSNRPAEAMPVEKKKLTTDLTKADEDFSLRLGFNSQIDAMQKENIETQKKQAAEIEELKRLLATKSTGNEGGAQKYGDLTLNGVPPSPYQGANIPQYNPSQQQPAQEAPKPVIITGGIASASIPKQPEVKPVVPEKVVNYLPSGTILKGTLLNGMYAPTMSKGKSKPYPALIRVQDLGFLPNGFRKDLAGCFVMGEAMGELSDSRVHIRLSKLSCISNNEKRVLDKSVKGFVNGDDGKVGIFGEIRANFGKVALGALLAEFISAAGGAVKSATQIVTQNPLGGITTTAKISEKDMLLQAAGAGFGESTKMIADFYLELMKEMTPVVEISGRRSVEIVIDEGIELLMKDFEWQGVKENEKLDIESILSRTRLND